MFERLTLQRDEPIADPAGLGYWKVAQAARAHGVPVLLLGQGGDELFWGYDWLRDVFAQADLKARLGPLGLLTPSGVRCIWRPCRPAGMKAWQVVQWLRGACGLRASWPGVRAYLRKTPNRTEFFGEAMRWRNHVSTGEGLFAKPFQEALLDTPEQAYFRHDQTHNARDVATDLTAFVCETYLRCNGLAQADRLCMAESIEPRVPLVDYRLVETAVGLRKVSNDAGLPPKHWLKQVAASLLPEWLLSMPKRGFTPPVAQWERALLWRFKESLRDGYLVQTGVLDPLGVERLIAAWGGAAPVSLLYKTLVLEVWCEQMSAMGGHEQSGAPVL